MSKILGKEEFTTSEGVDLDGITIDQRPTSPQGQFKVPINAISQFGRASELRAPGNLREVN